MWLVVDRMIPIYHFILIFSVIILAIVIIRLWKGANKKKKNPARAPHTFVLRFKKNVMSTFRKLMIEF